MLLLLLLLLVSSSTAISILPNTSISLPDPDSVADHLHRQVELSHRRALLQAKDQRQCLTGNPIDDCWRCAGTDWRSDRQRLAECGLGFGRDALGGKGGNLYVVTDSSDSDPVNPRPGTLRYAAIQDDPLWITFSADMTIRLSEELLVNSFKTIDGRGADVHIAGGACITLQYVSNVIIHNINIHHCVSAGNANIRSSPTHFGYRTRSDGDGISIYGARKIWIDHCSLSNCADGLIDAIMGSTGITISNNYFSHHDDVMLLGHSDDYLPDSEMQVTIAFNRFGEELVQRMPRCRRGYIHIVNNDFTQWEMYAIGGSANPTINSQGNRYTAPSNPNAKEVTKRVDTEDGQWEGWNWRSEGDVMVNGAFFVASGAGVEAKYGLASSVEPKSVALIDQLTRSAGVFGGTRETDTTGGPGTGTVSGAGGAAEARGGYGYLEIVMADRQICGVPERVQLHVAMLALQFGYAGFHVVSRAALNMGISKLVFPVYRNIIAFLLLLPFAFFLEKKDRPPITFSFLLHFFVLALIGITANQGFYLLGLENTTPTFASAIQNSVPALTFLMAAALRIEKVKINRRDGIAKLAGTLACVLGASVITLYKGPAIFTPSKSLNQYIENSDHHPSPMLWLKDPKGKSWTLGCLYLIGHCLSWSAWLVLQAPVLKKYPARLSVTAYTCFFGVLQFLVIALAVERDYSAWIFRSGGEFFTIFYAGFVASGIAFAVQIWCIDRGGPVFVAVYQPVQTLVVAIMASIALGEEFYLGGIIGAVLIVIGLYLVLYGKSEERAFAAKEAAIASMTNAEHDSIRSSNVTNFKTSSLAQPLLASSSESV
ncbi:hypothetical protein J5N97_023081 [Dioscorea zingiberensis]|uniref:Pectate lyase n=1 Tax=Dioscorea zingiberensis TaxID=325984 RepID=A0A9D5HB85_9LILI|nr:hypothetical protein J5N97_023081 [Dioscorea zingiberensis]